MPANHVDSVATAQYENAYQQVANMLEGKEPLSFKKAVFVTENVHHRGKLDYELYCDSIAATAQKLRQFIAQKGFENYKTAPNYAIYTYMKEPGEWNNHRPCIYDFEDFMGDEDYTSMHVTKLMQTRKGNCHSLPYYYKILAEEMGAEAHLAMGPNHIYIKHKAEDGEWINVELTSGGFPSDAWIIQSMEISVEAIKSEIYMEPLTEKQMVAHCLFDLAQNYIAEYGYDNFVLKCSYKLLEYDTNNIGAWLTIANALGVAGIALQQQGATPAEQKEVHDHYLKAQQTIEDLGYTDMSKEAYDAWVKSMEEEKTKQAQTHK